MSTQTSELISQAKNMPLEARAEIVDSLLESMQPTDASIDELWKLEVERRIDEYENGNVELIPGEAVFGKINERFSK
jgi:putative addiction module component (TIGR02574 family)